MTDVFTRRGFAGTLAAAALAPLIKLPLPGRTASTRTASAAAAADPGAEAQALAGALRARYGAQLGADDLKTIADQIHGGIHRAARLGSVTLENGDEPDFVFAPPAARGASDRGAGK